MSVKARRTLGLSEEEFERLKGLAASRAQSLDRTILAEGVFTESALHEALSSELDLELRPDLGGVRVPEQFLGTVPFAFAKNNLVVGLGWEDGELVIATATPLDYQPLDDVGRMTGASVRAVLASREEILALIYRAYEEQMGRRGEAVSVEVEGIDNLGGLAQQVTQADDLLDMSDRSPVIQLVKKLLLEALKMRGSDVHVQPLENGLIVRYRIDGVLHTTHHLPTKALEPIISRIKVLGRMDIAEKRLPQDGRASVKLGPERDVDIRISTVPSAYGERVVLRLLDKSLGVQGLEKLGFATRDMERFEQLIQSSHGVILVTGPTGSGKTTTLYQAIARINSEAKNVMTIEDPIEYQIPGITQCPVAETKGINFASGLRSILRQDPDIIMVGEVRDLETASMAIQASLTGHLVFTTLHTNDAASAATRLIDIGVEPYLVSSSVIAVLAQRLVRRICPHCKGPYTPSEAEVRQLDLPESFFENATFYRGAGCEKCMLTGYLQRTGIFELLVFDDEVRAAVMATVSSNEIKQRAVDHGELTTLRMDGARKVVEGLTTVEEVLSRTQMDLV